MEHLLELDDIQGIIRSGYQKLRYARFVFLQIGPAAKARAWLGGLIDEIPTAKERPGGEEWLGPAVHVAFTGKGLRALGLGDDVMGTFLEQFQVGMDDDDHARVLGDVNGSDPKHWHYGGPRKPVHVTLILYAHTRSALDEVYRRHRERFVAAGLRKVAQQTSTTRKDFREHFGFKDGISQPFIKGIPSDERKAALRNETPVATGEFILGYRNEYQQWPVSPMVPAELDRQGVLCAVDGVPSSKDLGRNGTYMVLRKLEQDVEAFWSFMRKASQGLSPHVKGLEQGTEAEWLAARMMGRWRSGAPITLCPMRDDPSLGGSAEKNNDFTYDSDREGLSCPIASHVRRSNPRDVLAPGMSTDAALKRTARHRIVRRGRRYGGEKSRKKGMVFIALNTNIARQFVFIQQTWVNNPKFQGLYGSRDPIVGANHEDGHHEEDEKHKATAFEVVIPNDPVRLRITGVPRFVHMRGGGYFFVPSIRALRFLSHL